MTHELSVHQSTKKEAKKRKKIIALKSMANEKDFDDELEESDNEYDLTLIDKKFRRFMREKDLILRRKAYL